MSGKLFFMVATIVVPLFNSAYAQQTGEGNNHGLATVGSRDTRSLDGKWQVILGWYAPWPAEPGNVVWKSNFNKPLIISEFGSEALYGTHGNADTASLWTEEHQEQLYRDNIAMFKKIPFLRGITPWILADFRTPFRMHAQFQEGWNRKGLLSDKGFKKKAWYVIHDYYQTLGK